jgi:hypothetical protein
VAASVSRENRTEVSSSGAGAWGRGPFALAQQHSVAVGVDDLHFAAERVRGMAGPDHRDAGRGQNADDGFDVVVEEIKQRGNCGMSNGGRVEASSTNSPF